ncbi:hypothetical protein GA0115255_117553, partial [Streptomyces sp. Ncost-T6T-2b]
MTEHDASGAEGPADGGAAGDARRPTTAGPTVARTGARKVLRTAERPAPPAYTT